MHKNKLKRIEELNVRPDTLQLLEEHIGRTHFDINHNNIFWIHLYSNEKKFLMDKWDLVRLKSFCTSK